MIGLQIKRFPFLKILRGFLIFALFALLFSLYFHSVTAWNQDLGRHLKIGQLIWQTKSIPQTNLFSYTQPDFPFINHHWLSELIFYAIYSALGDKGLAMFLILIALAGFAFMFRVSCKKGSLFIPIFASLLIFGLLFERTDLRPEIFGFLFFGLYYFILEKNKEKLRKSIIWLLPIQLAWANMHISFVFGPAIFFFFFVDRLWARRQSLRDALKKRKAEPYFIRIFLLGVALGAVCFLNPASWRGALYPFSVFGNYGYSIVENQSPFFLQKLMENSSINFFKAFLFFAAFGFLFNIAKTRLFYFLSVLFFSVISCFMIRHFPFLGLVALPFLAESYQSLAEKIKGRLEKRKNWRLGFGILSPILAVVLLAGGIYGFASGKIYAKTGKSEAFNLAAPKQAQAAVDFIQENKISGKMFNNFDIGSYLIWRLYPSQKVFIDGRPEAYPADFLQSVYIPMQRNRKDWKKYSDEVYKFDYVFWAHTDQTPWGREFLRIISEDGDWRLVYLNGDAAIWIRNISQNQDLINKFGIDSENLEKKLKVILEASNDFFDLAHLAAFFADAGQDEASLAAYEKAFEINSSSAQTAYVIGLFYGRKGDAGNAELFFKKALAINKKYAPAYIALGEIYYMRNNFSEARAVWKKALSLDPSNETAKNYLDNMGLVPMAK